VVRLLSALLLLLQTVISVRTELVAVPVIVTDARGQRVTGLAQENFRVFEDGRRRDIVVFHRGGAAVSLGLIVDRSQSMREKRPALRAAVSALLQSTRPDDQLFAVVFNDGASLALRGDAWFTGDARELETALATTAAGGRTALYDGVAQGLQQLQRAEPGAQALVVVSDGGDNASRRTYAEVLALARQSDAVVYAIGLMATPPADEEEDAGLLKRLCRDTGGIAYFPRTADEIVTVSSQIARDLRDQYTLGFTPDSRAARSTFRKIDVTVSASGRARLHVRTRSGYVLER
jgi:Ca-activated chloride channel homolog